MATMISAMTTTAVFSVILSSFVSDAKADKRDAAAMVLKRAQETLKNYVSADPTNGNMFPGTAPARTGSPVGSSGAVGHWDAEPGNTFWALRDGNHSIDSLVSGPPLTVPGSPPATLSYNVTSYPCGVFTTVSPNNQALCKRVIFRLDYAE